MKVFVEIGVGLYDTCHQLLENGWSGIMIEPLKEVCDKIVPHPNLSVENVAISGSGTIYDYSFVGLDQIGASQKYLDLIDRLNSLGYLVYQENEDVYCIR